MRPVVTVVLSCVAVIFFALSWFDQRARMSAISRQLASLVQQTGLLAAADVSHKHVDVREFIISSQISRVQDPVIIVGDSVTEAAILPIQLCGHPVINAGIGGA
jgi:hypothetical protein